MLSKNNHAKIVKHLYTNKKGGDHLDKSERTVGGIVIRDNKVLLVRHTYGAYRGKLLIPGGYIKQGEMPEIAAAREVFEETGVVAEAESILCIRFLPDAWYVAFMMRYISGEPVSDGIENSEAAFFDLNAAVKREDLTLFSRRMLESLKSAHKMKLSDYHGPNVERDTYHVYGMGSE
ncbi:MAG: NUDIX domain-containing protein [Acetivibrionales bacterium]